MPSNITSDKFTREERLILLSPPEWEQTEGGRGKGNLRAGRLLVTTSNKQFNLLKHVKILLKQHGRCGIVVPATARIAPHLVRKQSRRPLVSLRVRRTGRPRHLLAQGRIPGRFRNPARARRHCRRNRRRPRSRPRTVPGNSH